MNFNDLGEHLLTFDSSSDRITKAKHLAPLLRLPASESMAAVHLCQARLAETHLVRSKGHLFQRPVKDEYRLAQANAIPPERELQLRNELERTKGEFAPVSATAVSALGSLAAFHDCLSSLVSPIDTWLSGKGQVPLLLGEIYSMLGKAGRACLLNLLVGPLVSDDDILTAIEWVIGSGGGARKTIENVYRYTLPDLGVITRLLIERDYLQVAQLIPQPGVPLKPEELTEWDSLENAWQEYGPCFAEPKYDGWEIQIHKQGASVSLYNRHLQFLNPLLPDVVKACLLQISAEAVILDCEMVGYQPYSRRILPWEQTVHETTSAHLVFVHDILVLNGQDWRGQKFVRRRECLHRLLPADDTSVLRVAHDEFVEDYRRLQYLYRQWSTARDTEGIILKKKDGIYLPGRETRDQGKVKPYASLDVLVLGCRVSGKNIPSVLVGVWDEHKINLILMGWVEGTIATPQDQRKLLECCESLRTRSKPAQYPGCAESGFFWVRPGLVVEVRTDAMRKKSEKFWPIGYTFRKKRKLRIREEKGPEDADDITKFLGFRLPPGFDV